MISKKKIVRKVIRAEKQKEKKVIKNKRNE